MMKKAPLLILLVLQGFNFAQAPAPTGKAEFPTNEWTQISPAKAGWNSQKLNRLRSWFQMLPPASLFVVDNGRVIVDWGDSARKVKISSMRKSILSALFGIYIEKTKFNLDRTIGSLDVDDDPPLSEQEKKATVRMLLEARSGIYHSYVAGTPAMREKMPARGSHQPGSFWFYNNWDFNALGTIFELQFHQPIAEAFRESISDRTQMQDFLVQDMYYLRARKDSPDYERSRHPAYHFRMSARDLARFGYLMLQGGRWNGVQVIPSNWVEESVRSYSDIGEGGGYGYLWWIDGFGLPMKTFSAEGALAKYIIVVPDRHLVVVLLNHTEFPDNASEMSIAELNALPTISRTQVRHLLQLLIEAQERPSF